MVDLERLLHDCLVGIGGNSNSDVRWYLSGRPKRVTRVAFFREASWAIFVTGVSRKSAQAFMDRAKALGPIQDYVKLSAWSPHRLQTYMEKLHGRPVPARAKGKWTAIHSLARKLRSYSSEAAFRDACFEGKIRSSELNDQNVDRLAQMRLPFIGEQNAHFIIRNMGGEAVKCDRWIRVLLRRYRMTLKRLTAELHARSIRLGLFDIVVWAYCERFVRNTRDIRGHFGDFGLLVPREKA